MPVNRKRRRQTCSKCGQSFSSSWINEHRKKCGLTSCEEQNISVNDNTETISSDTVVDEVEEQRISSDTTEMRSSPDAVDPSSCLNGQALPNNISNLLRARLQSRRFELEDQEFFDNVEEQSTQEQAVEPPTETWDDLEDTEIDFNSTRDNSESTAEISSSNEANKSKIEVLVMWMMLFLTSWQSQHGITDTAISALIKFLCHFFWLLGCFDNTMALLSKSFPR